MSKHRMVSILASSALAAAAVAMAGAGLTASAATAGQPIAIQTGPNGNFQDNFNPYSSTADPGTDGLIYETLFYFDNISGKTFDVLGNSFKFSHGNKVVTVNLHPNVKWSDGTPFTAQDVVFSFDQLKKYPAADANGVWTQLQSVKAVGKNQVVFTFKAPNGPFAEQYVLGGTYIVPQHIWKSLGDPTKVSVTKPVGTGPYELSSFSPQLYKLTANPSYYRGVSKVPEVDFPAYSSNASADLALAKGDLQWTGIDIPNIQQTFVKADPAHNHYWFPPSNVVQLYTNLKDPLLSQKAVREAMSLAIDRNKLSAEGETGYELPAVPTSLVMPNNKAWLDPKLPKQYNSFSYNSTAAEKILTQAGFKKDSKGIMAKGGKELSFTLDVVAGWSDWDEDALLIKQELSQIGIGVNVNQMQFGAYYNAIAPAKPAKPNYQLAISWTNTGPTPYTLYYNMLDPNGNFNVPQFNDPSVTGWLNDFARTANPARQRMDIFKIQSYFAQNLPAIPLLFGATWYEYNDANYTGWPTQKNPWINPAPYTYQAAAIVLEHLKPVK